MKQQKLTYFYYLIPKLNYNNYNQFKKITTIPNILIQKIY